MVFDPNYKHTGLDRFSNIEQYLVANGGSVPALGAQLFVGKAHLDVTRALPIPRAAAFNTTITTPYTGINNSIVEPSVLYDPNGWGSDSNGKAWRYWMAAGPYGGTAANENPSLWVSDDGDTWQVPPGLTNPVVAAPASGNYDDPHLCWDENGVLHLTFNHSNDTTTALNGVWYTNSTDGIHWAAITQILAAGDSGATTLLSPMLSRDMEAKVFHLWDLTLVGSTYTIRHRSASTVAGLAAATVTACTGLTATGADGSPTLFEFEVARVGGEWWMLLCSRNDTGTFPGSLSLAASSDGVAWRQSGILITGTGKTYDWDYKIYKSAFVPMFAGDEGYLDVWYNGWGNSTLPTVTAGEHIARSRITFAPPTPQVSGSSSSGSAFTAGDAATYPLQQVLLTGSPTVSLPTPTPGKSFDLLLVQDLTGSRTVTWPTTVVWASATAPTLATTAGHADLIHFECIGSWWLATVLAANISAPIPLGYLVRYDASAITGVADGATLATWPDISGNGNDLAQPFSANRPTYYKSTSGKLINSLPAVWFDGTASYMFSRSYPLTLSASTIIAVAQTTSTSTARNIVDGLNVFRTLAVESTGWYMNAGTKLEDSTTPDKTGAHMLAAVYNGASSVLYLDGTSVATGTAGTNSPDGITLGTVRLSVNSVTNVWSGPICELIVYPGALSSTQVTTLHTYLSAKWGTP